MVLLARSQCRFDGRSCHQNRASSVAWRPAALAARELDADTLARARRRPTGGAASMSPSNGMAIVDGHHRPADARFNVQGHGAQAIETAGTSARRSPRSCAGARGTAWRPDRADLGDIGLGGGMVLTDRAVDQPGSRPWSSGCAARLAGEDTCWGEGHKKGLVYPNVIRRRVWRGGDERLARMTRTGEAPTKPGLLADRPPGRRTRRAAWRGRRLARLRFQPPRKTRDRSLQVTQREVRADAALETHRRIGNLRRCGAVVSDDARSR
jgi:hypothetical protein